MDRERDRERDGAPREGLLEEEEDLHGCSLPTWELPRPTSLAARRDVACPIDTIALTVVASGPRGDLARSIEGDEHAQQWCSMP